MTNRKSSVGFLATLRKFAQEILLIFTGFPSKSENPFGICVALYAFGIPELSKRSGGSLLNQISSGGRGGRKP
jgi:hypothetical protein